MQLFYKQFLQLFYKQFLQLFYKQFLQFLHYLLYTKIEEGIMDKLNMTALSDYNCFSFSVDNGYNRFNPQKSDIVISNEELLPLIKDSITSINISIEEFHINLQNLMYDKSIIVEHSASSFSFNCFKLHRVKGAKFGEYTGFTRLNEETRSVEVKINGRTGYVIDKALQNYDEDYQEKYNKLVN